MPRTRTMNQASAALWASAFVVGALVIVQAGRLPGNAAHAEMSTTKGDFVVLTTTSGRGGDNDPDELLYVIDNRNQAMLAYETEPARGRVELRDGGSLVNIFRQARP